MQFFGDSSQVQSSAQAGDPNKYTQKYIEFMDRHSMQEALQGFLVMLNAINTAFQAKIAELKFRSFSTQEIDTIKDNLAEIVAFDFALGLKYPEAKATAEYNNVKDIATNLQQTKKNLEENIALRFEHDTQVSKSDISNIPTKPDSPKNETNLLPIALAAVAAYFVMK